jgi:thiol-disulfide isomerase/thioredoxin
MTTTIRRKPRKSVRWWPLVTALGVLALVVVLAVTTTGDNGGNTTGPVVGGDPLPAFDGIGATDPAIGSLVPNLVGSDFDGNTLNPTRNHRAKLFVFLAHWCNICQVEVPVLVDWLNDGRVGDVQVIGIVTGTDPLRPNYPPEAWLEEEGWPTQLIVDGDEDPVARAYGLTGTPYFVVTDDEDRVVARSAGELTTDELDALVAAAS